MKKVMIIILLTSCMIGYAKDKDTILFENILKNMSTTEISKYLDDPIKKALISDKAKDYYEAAAGVLMVLQIRGKMPNQTYYWRIMLSYCDTAANRGDKAAIEMRKMFLETKPK